ncbi:MAG: hypothetical protein HZA28_07055 [Candidatus Omnitrophica bacterium]|nr:hypothetical protein [Candidatus Omnitrophota bacterium]
MSIINEAIKKTQTIRQITSPAANNRPSPSPKTWAEPEPVLSVTHSISSPEPQPEAPARAKQKKWHIIVLLEILFLLFIVGVLFILQPKFFSWMKPDGNFSLPNGSSRPQMNSAAGSDKKIQPQQPPPALATAPAITPAAVLAPAINHKPNRNLVVNGIMMNNGKIAALINGEIYEVGHYVNGKKITNITLNDVILMDKDGMTVLSVRKQKQ